MTAIELMPVATFPGERGWGYDGLYPFAPHPAYGGPDGSRGSSTPLTARASASCSTWSTTTSAPATRRCARSGPTSPTASARRPGATRSTTRSGACASGRSRTPSSGCATTGSTGSGSTPSTPSRTTRRVHVLAELAERVRGHPCALVISEMGPPDFRPLREWGHDAMWLDSLHHALHVALTGEQDGYYAGFDGSMARIAAELSRPEGPRIVAAAQNHDQVGNRALGDRLRPSSGASRRPSSSSPFTPLLFQGEEYGESGPFQFFTDHIDPFIADATREGRRREFATSPASRGEVPDPQDAETFERSKLTPRAPEQLYATCCAAARAAARARGFVRRGARTLELPAAAALELRADFARSSS